MNDQQRQTALNERVAANVREVHERISAAADRSGRGKDLVKLVAVSKYASVDDGMIEALWNAGCTELGESRPQLLLEKATHFGSIPFHWHLIGSLQRNKIRKILSHTALIHSMDSLRLAEAIDRIVEEENQAVSEPLGPIDVLIEVDVSGDETKHGFEPREVCAALEEISNRKNLSVKGLMCMSGLESDESRTRREFESLRLLAESLQKKGLPTNISLDELSMGMSDDFEIAVEEGATIVRVGSLLYR